MRNLPSCPTPLAGTLLSLLVASAAAAQPTVDPARYQIVTYRRFYESGTDEFLSYTTPGTYSTPNGAATVSVKTSPFTLLTAHATTDDNNTLTTARASMFYSFRIVGAPGTRVAASFTADMFARVVGDIEDELTLAISSFNLFRLGVEGSFYDAEGNDIFTGPRVTLRLSGGPAATFNTPVKFIVDANAQYEVELAAVAQTLTTGVVADAYIDPVITIDPAQQGAYSLVLSPGVSNLGPTATVPEPGTLALVGTGVLGAFGVARRRRVADRR